MRMAEAPMSWKQGGCHCGAVRFEVLAPDEIEAKECNCSICRMTDYLHLIVDAERFRLLTGADVPMPYAANLEKLALPSVEGVVEAVKSVCYRT